MAAILLSLVLLELMPVLMLQTMQHTEIVKHLFIKLVWWIQHCQNNNVQTDMRVVLNYEIQYKDLFHSTGPADIAGLRHHTN
jgi:hypothetical protein